MSDTTHDIKCWISLEESNHLRRCFMTGEYCSKQTNIQKERKILSGTDDKREIKAFVIMDFSAMSDVLYEWRICKYIESLAGYFYVDKKNKKLYCCDKKNNPKEGCVPVSKIQVVRSDTEPASNYVICNRICQQIQIADLVVVDVSRQNPNVFYELGLAIAMGKMILPICYSESYYKREIPEQLKEIQKNNFAEYSNLEHHIGLYPWRKKLFEYYGIRYIRGDNSIAVCPEGRTQYLNFDLVKDPKYGFSDSRYSRFPYHEVISKDLVEKKYKNLQKDDEIIRIGPVIYRMLQDQYNESSAKDNTLIVYTMDSFLNKLEAGRCIVNFYRNITSRLREEECFCGDRVGVLVQDNYVPEKDKDVASQWNLAYDVGDIIHIGVNQATFQTEQERIKVKETKKLEITNSEVKERHEEEITRFVKEHVRNRGLLIYPNYPVYVSRVVNRLQEDLLKIEGNDNNRRDNTNAKSFCFYHVMLKTLKYVNQIVVDISNNCLQALFWLGVAHGMDVHAVTVLHEQSKKEKEMITGNAEKNDRNVFDVSGLWTAIFRSNDTTGFYKQLASVQRGIEDRSKLLLKNRKEFEERLWKALIQDGESATLDNLKGELQDEEKEVLESYYRRCFWNTLLRFNKLQIIIPQEAIEGIKDTSEKFVTNRYISQTSLNIISVFSRYLSKRTAIGEYRIVCSSPFDENLSDYNYIRIEIDKAFTTSNKTVKDDKKKITINKVSDSTTPKNVMVKLLRKRQEDGQGYNTFCVLIKSNSENTAYDIATLFVDSILKEQSLIKEEKKNKYLLYDLQKEIRHNFKTKLSKAMESNKNMCKDIEGENSAFDEYKKLLSYAIESYLDTILYQYFIPFLTKRDIKSIVNGFRLYVNSMVVARISPFDPDFVNFESSRYKEVVPRERILNIAKELPKILQETLENITTVEYIC